MPLLAVETDPVDITLGPGSVTINGTDFPATLVPVRLTIPGGTIAQEIVWVQGPTFTIDRPITETGEGLVDAMLPDADANYRSVAQISFGVIDGA